MKPIIVTGMLRSGTTLLEKLLFNHKEISIYYQPLTGLFIELKRKFHEINNIKIPYHVIGNYFFEQNYAPNDFLQFLKEYKLSLKDIESLKNIDENLITRKELSALISGKELSAFEMILKIFESINKKKNAKYSGIKEVLIEEFIPYFVSQKCKSIIIVRDPRDVIASLNYGNAEKYTGASRPTLFNLRNWRKSVAFFLFSENDSNFMWLRYEDLLENPLEALNKISKFLEIKSFPEDFFENTIFDQDGNVWKSNSSFEQNSFITQDSKGKYLTLLSKSMIDYIEAICYPEMYFLGYTKNKLNENYEKIIKKFREPFEILRPEFDADYSYKEDNLEKEIKRLNIFLARTPEKKTIQDYFLFEKSYKKILSRF